ncbi:MAG: hypothetical protein V4474_00225 [Patescibacteria group bacterium]
MASFYPVKEVVAKIEHALASVYADHHDEKKRLLAIRLLGHTLQQFADQLKLDHDQRDALLPFARNIVGKHLNNKELLTAGSVEDVLKALWGIALTLGLAEIGIHQYIGISVGDSARDAVTYACIEWRSPKRLAPPKKYAATIPVVQKQDKRRELPDYIRVVE